MFLISGALFWGTVYAIIAFFLGWWPFDNETNLFNFNNDENISVNAYFYYPNDQEVYLGQHMGVSACQSAASNFAINKDILSSNWSYICCTIEKGSSCYRKIK